MSTSTQELLDSTDVLERRFYSRVAPNAPVYLAIDGNNSLLLNVSENGLLVSTPVALQCNFVARIDIPLPGLPNPVQVNVRVVWASEIRKLAGIQLLDLDDYDREQIRKWGARESRQFLYEESEEGHIAPSSSEESSATPLDDVSEVEPPPSDAEVTEEEIPSSEEMALAGPVLPPTPRPTPRVSTSIAPEVTTSPAARIALWVMGIAAIFLAAFFLLKTVSGISFAHSREIFHRSGVDASPPPETLEIPETPALPVRANPPNLGSSYSYVAANAGPPPRTLDPAKSKHATSSALASPDPKRSNEGAEQAASSAIDGETLGASSFNSASNQRDTVQHNTAPASSAATKSLLSQPPAAPSHRIADSSVTAANPNSAPSGAASKSAAAFANSSPFTSRSTSTTTGATTSAAPGATLGTSSASIYAPAANAPLSNAIRNPTRPEGVLAPSAPATIPARPSSAPNSSYLAPRNVSSPVIQPAIQMDTPERQTMEIHLQSGYRGPFFNLPGERVLESSSATMRIQRSVRMPATHSLWPFNRNNKKVVVGGLMSRVDPQIASNQIRYADIVRVVATVGEDGRVESVKPIHGSANLLPNVLKAVQQWRYQPTLIDGKPVETQCDVLFQFHAPTERRAQR
jgi:hypothetical protein